MEGTKLSEFTLLTDSPQNPIKSVVSLVDVNYLKKSFQEVLDKLLVPLKCDNEECCCLPPRSTIAIISVISLVACLVDIVSNEACASPFCDLRDYVESMRLLLVMLFQMANMLLLLASIVENAFLVQIYVWYTLGFIVLGLLVAILDFLYRMKQEGMWWSFISFLPDVAFLFVLFRCLPLVDTYRKHLDGLTSIST